MTQVNPYTHMQNNEMNIKLNLIVAGLGLIILYRPGPLYIHALGHATTVYIIATNLILVISFERISLL